MNSVLTKEDFKSIDITINEHISLLVNQRQEINDFCLKVSEKIITVSNSNNKVILAGNGGSLSDSQHFSTELLVKFKSKDRKKIYSTVLGSNQAELTAASNDYSFNDLFCESFKSIYKEGDCLIVLSTSLKSKNILRLIDLAKKNNVFIIGLFGKKINVYSNKCNLKMHVKSFQTARIQEIHYFIFHQICEILELYYTKKNK